MARNRGAFNFSGSLEIKKNSPLDARIVVDTIAELTQSTTWQDDESKVWLYNGIVVSVIENAGLYQLTNYDPVNTPTAYSDLANWKQIDASAAKIELVDNLESTSTTAALTANQGKVLKDLVDTHIQALQRAYVYGGTVDNYSDLPTSAEESPLTVGIVYNVVNANGNIPAGTNYAWNGESWDALGGTVDLSNYATLSKVTDDINNALVPVNAEIEALEKTVGEHTTALSTLNGESTVNGSVKWALQQSKDYTDGKLAQLVTDDVYVRTDGNNTGTITIDTADGEYVEIKKLSTLVGDGKQISFESDGIVLRPESGTTPVPFAIYNESLDNPYDLVVTESSLKSYVSSDTLTQITTNKNNIATLMADANTTGSVDNKIAAALEWYDISNE